MLEIEQPIKISSQSCRHSDFVLLCLWPCVHDMPPTFWKCCCPLFWRRTPSGHCEVPCRDQDCDAMDFVLVTCVSWVENKSCHSASVQNDTNSVLARCRGPRFRTLLCLRSWPSARHGLTDSRSPGVKWQWTRLRSVWVTSSAVNDTTRHYLVQYRSSTAFSPHQSSPD